MGEQLWDALNKLRSSELSRPEEIAEFFETEGIRFARHNLATWGQFFASRYGRAAGMFQLPEWLAEVFEALAKESSAKKICDPWAGIGFLVATLREACQPIVALAFTQNHTEYALGKALVPQVDWHLGESLELLRSAPGDFDLIASILPMGANARTPLAVKDTAGENLDLRDDLGNLVMVSASLHLNANGIGLFVVTPSFFFSQRSVFRHFSEIGLGVEAALALPSGTFAPYTNVAAYLIVVRRQRATQMFVAQLSSDTKANHQIIENLHVGREAGSLELGRFVDADRFIGLDAIRVSDRFKEAEKRFSAPAIRLGELATEINLGRPSENFEFPVAENAVFVPLIGKTRVLNSADDLTLKKQNYAQIVIDPSKSNAQFIARFLNSNLGKEYTEASKTGFIPKLNKRTLQNLTVFVPPLSIQQEILEVETRIAAEHNLIVELEIELSDLRDRLWEHPSALHEVKQQVSAFAQRLPGSLAEHAADRLDQWFETLPFPLASILRAWQATQSDDFKSKYEHLLHYFEATAEFLSVILLSAFSSNPALFAPHRQTLSETMQTQSLSFQRATFGTWKLVVEYLSKQVRRLLSENGKKPEDAKNDRALCAEMFSDPSLALPEALSRKDLVAVLSTTNKMRNDWTGHGGVVGMQVAQLRNEQLLAELQKVREAFSEIWPAAQLLHAVHCRLRRGWFENEVAVLMGSNSEFLKETRRMTACLDVERLYLAPKDSARALQLLPLVKVGASPSSAKNACYFFNRLDGDRARFISYHFTGEPDLKDSEDTAEAIRLLTQQT